MTRCRPRQSSACSRTKELESAEFLRAKAGVEASLGVFPREWMNPDGGSVALGHPFGATGARILSQAVKELASRPSGERAIDSSCTDGSAQGTSEISPK